MKKHRYRITVEYLADTAGTPMTDVPLLQFEARNHDEILSVVDRVKSRGDFCNEDATAFAVGLKLFSEIMLENKSKPLFKDFLPHFGNFMKQLKHGHG